LRWQLSSVQVGGRQLAHWQIEVTGAGWVWYLVDADKATIWIGYAGPGHPKATD
jgi:hypothetical protein